MESERYLAQIEEQLNRVVLHGAIASGETIKVGKMYVARYVEDNRFYRCQVISAGAQMTHVSKQICISNNFFFGKCFSLSKYLVSFVTSLFLSKDELITTLKIKVARRNARFVIQNTCISSSIFFII